MAAWDRIAAAVTHRRSWVIAMLIAAGAGVVIVLAGANTGADKAPLQLPAESARAAALLELFPGGGEMPAILVVPRSPAPGLPSRRATPPWCWRC
jgi:RND superfamily putative drug exporter